tara:strand:+ start:810 stop:1034 length:225 start_codon:yes stop_codon:yes gene_type:complete
VATAHVIEEIREAARGNRRNVDALHDREDLDERAALGVGGEDVLLPVGDGVLEVAVLTHLDRGAHRGHLAAAAA